MEKLLAAYLLGFLTRRLATYLEVFGQMRSVGLGQGDGIADAFEQMIEAILALAEEIPHNIYIELRARLKRQFGQWA